MTKILITVLFFVFSILNLQSQTFTFTKINPAQYTYSADTIEIIDTGRVTVTGGSLQLRLIRTSQNLPTGWEGAMCDITACYPPEVDTAIATYSAGAHEVTFHFYHYHISGQGTMTIRCERVSNPSQNPVTITFGGTNNPIGIHQISSIVKDFSLNQNYPNPFNPTTKINFSLPKSEFVSLKVYDILGREVSSLITQPLSPGEYEYEFDAKNLSSGMYYYSLRAGENVAVKKMVLVK